MIFIDVYARQIFIPYYLATKEFVNLTKNHLKDGGIIAYNVSDDSNNKTRLKYISNTLVSVFPYTYIVYPNEGTEYLVVGSVNPVNFHKNQDVNMSPEFNYLFRRFASYSVTKVQTGDTKFVLTDDNSPEKI